MTYASKAFWTATAERAIKTAAQSLITLIGTDAVGILAIDWAQILSVTATMTLLSVLTSVASGPIGEPGPGMMSGEAITQPAPREANAFEKEQAEDQDKLDETLTQGDLSDEEDYEPEPVEEES
ncbi:holin [Brevibacterium paucivorans]|uniref:holin n=1 Tax=Brevibacterium paucivorans TaxID=170994 RepID=UPI00321A31B6